MKDIIYLGFNDIEIETKKGIWERSTIERKYPSNIGTNYMNRIMDNSVNTSKKVNLTFTIYMDSFIHNNIERLTYVRYKDILYNIDELVPNRPTLKIRIGGIYNGTTRTT